MTVGNEFFAGGLWKAGTHMAVMDRRRLRGGFRPASIQLRMHSHWRYRDTRTGIQRKPIIAQLISPIIGVEPVSMKPG